MLVQGEPIGGYRSSHEVCILVGILLSISIQSSSQLCWWVEFSQGMHVSRNITECECKFWIVRQQPGEVYDVACLVVFPVETLHVSIVVLAWNPCFVFST